MRAALSLPLGVLKRFDAEYSLCQMADIKINLQRNISIFNPGLN
jgi:hypothetical protein